MNPIQPDTQLPKKPRAIGRYTAIVGQIGTDNPTANVLYQKLPPNTTIVWTRISTGIYHGTLTGDQTTLPYSTPILTTTGYQYNNIGIVASEGGNYLVIAQTNDVPESVDGFSVNVDITFWDTNGYNPWN